METVDQLLQGMLSLLMQCDLSTGTSLCWQREPYSTTFIFFLVFGIAKAYLRRWHELLRANMPFTIANAFTQVSVNRVLASFDFIEL